MRKHDRADDSADGNDDQENNIDNQAIIPVNPTTFDLSYSKITWEIIKLATPYAGSSFIVIGGGILGVVFVARLGSNQLAASNLTSSIQNWFISTIGATLSSAAIIAGRKIGENKLDEVGGILHKSWLFTLILSIPSMTLMYVSKPILLSLHQNSEIVKLSAEYFYGFAPGLPAMFMLSSNRRIALATKNAHLCLIFDIFYQAIDAILSYSLIFGRFYLPKLGMAGLAYSNTITSWITFIIFSLYICLSQNFKSYGLTKANFNNFWLESWQLAKIGLPIGGKVGAELASILIANLMIGAMGSNQQAAQEASFQYIFLLSTPIFSIMDSVATLVSRSIGEKNIYNAKKYGNSGIALGVLISLIGLIIFIAIPKILLSAFIKSSDTNYKDILSVAKLLLIVNGFGLVLDSIRNIASGGLSGFYDTFIPTMLIIASLVIVNIPLSYIMGFVFNMEAKGVMLARDIGISIGAAILLGRWIIKDKVDQEQSQNNSAPDSDESSLLDNNATNEASIARIANIQDSVSQEDISIIRQSPKQQIWASLFKQSKPKETTYNTITIVEEENSKKEFCVVM